MLKETSCIAPFINLTVDPEHNTSPCPYLGGGSWNFKHIDNFKDIWKSEPFEKLRNSHLNGEKNETCRRCWNDESIGKESARQRILKDYKNILPEIKEKIKNKNYLQSPIILTMKNGNICNIKCRTCGPKDSSIWIPEAQHHVKNFSSNISDTWFQAESFKKNWTDQQMNNFKDFNKNIIRVEHYGGEPLYNYRVFEHTKMLVDEGLAKNITLYFNSNGTNLPKPELQDLFKYFKLVEFNLSIDGINSHFEYIRHPAKWNDLLITKDWLQKQENVIWGIVTTVSNLNVFYLDEITKEFQSWNKTNYYLNILENPKFYSIKNLPSKIKNIITKKFESNKNLSTVVKFMNSENNNNQQWDKFLFWTKQKDLYRKENFEFTFPEFYSIINS